MGSTSLNSKQREEYLKYHKKKKPAKKNRPRVKKKKKRISTKEAAHKLKNAQIKYRSKLEMRFKKILDENYIYHIWQQPFYTKSRYVCVDFYFPQKRLVIEIDGPHHDKNEFKNKDQERTKWIIDNFEVDDVLRVHYIDFKDMNLLTDIILDKLD